MRANNKEIFWTELVNIKAVFLALLLIGVSFFALLPSIVCAGSHADFNPPYGDYGLDTDGDGLYNYLVINFSITVTSPGLLYFQVTLFDSTATTSITMAGNNSFLPVGDHTIEVWLFGEYIFNSDFDGPYQARLFLTNDTGYTQYDWHTTYPYLRTDFDPPSAYLTPPHSDYGLDTDSPPNGLFNYLVVEVNINVTVDGTYDINGYLFDQWMNNIDEDTYTSFFSIGSYTVQLMFYGPYIHGNGENGPFEVWLDIVDDQGEPKDHDEHETNSYLYTDFEFPVAYFNPPHSDYGLDTDSPPNGLFDYLVVEVNINVTLEQNYQVMGILTDNFGFYIDETSTTSLFVIGLHTVTLYFDGRYINKHGESGPMKIHLVILDMSWKQIDTDDYTTAVYLYTMFDPPPASFSPPHSDYGLDTDSPPNGLFDFLVVNININVEEEGIYEIEMHLYYPLKYLGMVSNTSFFSIGSHTVELRFFGLNIYKAGENSTIGALFYLYNETKDLWDENDYNTNFYNYTDFDPPPASFSPPHSDHGLDTDIPANGFYDYLVIEVNLNVTEACDVTLLANLRNEFGMEYIVGSSNSTFLNTGLQTIQIYFDGWVIGLLGINGPYSAELKLWYQGLTHLIDTDYYTTNSYSFGEFEAQSPSIVSSWTASPPTVDGLYSPSEWADATQVDLGSITGNMINVSLFVKNDAENLYICYDVVGDTILDTDDVASIAFDSSNDGVGTEGREDQFVVGGIDEYQAHHVWGNREWVVEDSPFNDSLPNHETLEADWGFGGSDNSPVNHRIYEFQIPLALIGTALGDTIGFAGCSEFFDNYEPGIGDDARAQSCWPAFFLRMPSLKVFGDLTIAPSPDGNVPPTLKDGSVIPISGVADSTSFTFQVTYRDANDDPPVSVEIWINKSGIPIGGPYSMNFESWIGEPGKYISGAVYSYSTTLTIHGNDYTFAFGVSDGAVYVSTIEKSGPEVLSRPDPPINLGVQGFPAGTSDSLNITDRTPDLTWTFSDPDGPDQGGYNVSVWSGPGGTGTLMWWDNQTSSSSIVTYDYDGTGLPLNDGTDYYLRVKTMDGDGLWGGSAEMKFHMNTPPPIPINNAPSNGVTLLQSASQTVQWEGVTDFEGSMVTYYWYVSLDPSFNILCANGVTPNLYSSQFTTSAGNTYYWRVRAHDGYGFGGNSTTWSFNVTSQPNKPLNLGAGGFAAGTPESLNLTDHTPELSWTFSDPDGDLQGGFNVSVWTGPEGTGTLMWWDNQTGSLTQIVYDGPQLIDGEDYYFRVGTMDEWGIWGDWAEMRFHMNTVPPTPANNVPSNGVILLQSASQTVQWEGVTDFEGSTVTYHWYISMNPSFDILYASGSTSNLNSDQFTTSAGNTYYWKVRAYDGYEFGLNSSIWSFEVSNPPNPPINLGVQGFTASTPGSLSITDHTPKLNWTFDGSGGGTQGRYNVSVWIGPGGTGTLMWSDNQTGAQTSVIYDGLELSDGEDYYLRVKTMDEYGFWSDWVEMKFHMNTPPSSPILDTPNNGDTELEYGVQELDWNEVIDFEGGTITYEWCVSTDSSFSDIIADGSCSENTASFTTSPTTKYHWKVRAYDGYEWGEYSAAWSFTTTQAKGTISGSIYDEKGSAIQDAKVQLYNSTDNLITTVYTDSSGSFTFNNIFVGNGYYLNATKEDFEDYISDAITVNEDQNTIIPDIQMVIKKGIISGTVQDEKEKAIQYAEVELIDSEGNTLDTAFTDDEGNFEFEDVEPGLYTIQISKEGYDIYTSDELILDPGEEKAVSEIWMTKKTEEPALSLWVILGMVIGAIVLIVIIFLILRKKKEQKPPVEQIPTSRGMGE